MNECGSHCFNNIFQYISTVTISILVEHPNTLLQTYHPQLRMISSVAGAPNIVCKPGIH